MYIAPARADVLLATSCYTPMNLTSPNANASSSRHTHYPHYARAQHISTPPHTSATAQPWPFCALQRSRRHWCFHPFDLRANADVHANAQHPGGVEPIPRARRWTSLRQNAPLRRSKLRVIQNTAGAHLSRLTERSENSIALLGALANRWLWRGTTARAPADIAKSKRRR